MILQGVKADDVTLEKALELLSFPRELVSALIKWLIIILSITVSYIQGRISLFFRWWVFELFEFGICPEIM